LLTLHYKNQNLGILFLGTDQKKKRKEIANGGQTKGYLGYVLAEKVMKLQHRQSGRKKHYLIILQVYLEISRQKVENAN
jgi:hypothetical protein